jgi:hypothetical protein
MLQAARDLRPSDDVHLRWWLRNFTGAVPVTSPVCRGHQPPFWWFRDFCFKPPRQALVLAPRGGGKSFLTAVLTHLESRFNPGLKTRILGGSQAQSMQIYEAISEAVRGDAGRFGGDAGAFERVLKEDAYYKNGSHVGILAASPTSVRGPHVARLRLDEVDEIDPDLRDAAYGMVMARGGVPGSITMTSTWHRVGGPMSELVARAEAGEFPLYRSCAFDVLERCPEERSGRWVGGDAGFERCPECALKPWCHAERDLNPAGLPLAKLSHGHYAIDSLIQKAQGVSRRAFEADYLCRGPRADGVWFKDFDPARHVTLEADYDPRLPVHLSIDGGVFTGAVAFQVRPQTSGRPKVNVFMDYLSEGVPAAANARLVLEKLGPRNGPRRRVSTDPALDSRTAVGPTVVAEYAAGGLTALERWPRGPVADSLALLEALISSADGGASLSVHPSCKDLTTALLGYRRAKRGGQWQDYPEDPQHPHEDLVDALRGGLKLEFPEGLTPAAQGSSFLRVAANRVF